MEACGSCGPDDLENYIHWGWKASRNLSGMERMKKSREKKQLPKAT